MKITFLAAFVALSGISVTHAQTLIFTELTRLAGTNNLELGISIDELKKRKPKVLGFPFRNAHQDIQPDDAIEILADASFFDDKYGAIWYHNLGGKLRGISICRRFSSELVENLGSFIRKQTSQGRLYSLESSQVIRSDGLRAFVVTAHHWETVTEGFKFYILATNREVNVVLYDPAFLGLDAFFVPKKELNRVQENFARLSRTLSSASTAHPNSSNEGILDVPLKLGGSDTDDVLQVKIPQLEMQNAPDNSKLQKWTSEQSELPSSPLPWSILVALIVGALGLLWFLYKRRP